MVDCFDNRSSVRIFKGDVLEVTMLADDGSKTMYPHVCITLNTGYNLLIEKQTLDAINRRVEELE